MKLNPEQERAVAQLIAKADEAAALLPPDLRGEIHHAISAVRLAFDDKG